MQDVPVKLWSVNKIMRAVNLWRDGLTPDEIARELAVSERDVRDHLPEMGKFGLIPVDRL
jgi:predicted transcriptional regulator